MKITFRNYIPHKTPQNNNFLFWQNHYKDYLLEIYIIFKENMTQGHKNPRLLNYWNSEKAFNDVCFLIFTHSSGHISDYI